MTEQGENIPIDVTPNNTPNQMPLSESEERTWAMIAHLTIFLNLITGILGTVAALIIYLVFRDRSKYVAYQSLQAMLFQLVFFIGGGVIIGLAWLITGLLSIVIVGLLLIPVALVISLLPIGCFIYAIMAAVATNEGQDFQYWLVGDWVRETYIS